MLASITDAESLIDIVSALPVRCRQFLSDLLKTLNLETDVMYSRPILAALDSCDLVVLETQDREIQVSIGQVVSGCDRAVELRDFFQAKGLNVELGSFILVLRSDRDVFDLCHGNLLYARRI